MPTAYLKKIHEEQGIALKKLEEYWAKAKKIAKERGDLQGQEYWKYVMGIFQNMASLNGVSVSSCYESVSARVAKALRRPARGKQHPAPKRGGRNAAKVKKSLKAVKKKPQHAARPHGKAKAQLHKGKVQIHGKKQPAKQQKHTTSKKAVALPEWWVKKTEYGQQKYLERYPNSKFADKVAKSNPKLRQIVQKARKLNVKTGKDEPIHKEAENEVNDKNVQPEVEQQVENPKDKLEAAPPTPQTKSDQNDEETAPTMKEQKYHKSLFHKAYFEGRKAIGKQLQKNRAGMHAVGRFLKGRNLNTNEKKLASSWAMTAAKLVVGCAVGVALFTPLAGLAPELGQNFLSLLRNGMVGGMAGESDSAEATTAEDMHLDLDHFTAEQFTDLMHDWLMKQNIPELVEQLKQETAE